MGSEMCIRDRATAVQIKLVPADDQAVVSVKDVGIEACIEKGNHLFGAVFQQYKRKTFPVLVCNAHESYKS